MGSSASGSETSTTAVPQYLEDASRYNLNRGVDAANIGYVPKYGPDVAALTPLQLASINNLSQNANAFGMAGGNVTGGSGMPDPMEFAGGINAYSSAPAFQEMVSNLQANNPDKYNQIENYFKGGSATGGALGSGGGYNTGGPTSSGGSDALNTIAAIAGLGTAKSLLGKESLVGDAIVGGVKKLGGMAGFGGGAAPAANIANTANTALNLSSLNTLAPNAINAGAQFAAPAGYGVSFGGGGAAANSALSGLSGFGGYGAAPSTYGSLGGLSGASGGLTSSLPVGFGGGSTTGGALGSVGVGGVGGGGGVSATGGTLGSVGGGGGSIGGLFGGQAFGGGAAGALGAVAAPIAAFGAAIPASKFLARDVMGFGNETDKRREQLADFSLKSGLNDFKTEMSQGFGDYSTYLDELRPPDDPFQADLSNIEEGDRSYAEEQVSNLYNTPWGKAQMAQYYLDNPKHFNPDGSKSDYIVGLNQRGAAAVDKYIKPTMDRNKYNLINGSFRQTRN